MRCRVSPSNSSLKQHVQTPNFQDTILALAGSQKRPRILLGLSGGADSVFLFHVLKSMHAHKQIQLACAHVNYGWRETSGRDEQFVVELCTQHNVPLHTAHARDLEGAIKETGSKEDAARQMRRNFFEAVLTQWDGDCIALAHHADDQQETFFMRLMRGATLTGLVGIRPRAGKYIRPLLHMHKKEIVEYLHRGNLKFVHDETNDSAQFLRNRIRTALHECDARFDQKFASTLTHLQTAESYLEYETQNAYKNVFSGTDGDLQKFNALHPFLQKRVLMLLLQENNVEFMPSDAFLDEMLRFLHTPRGGTHQLHNTWAIHKKSGRFWL